MKLIGQALELAQSDQFDQAQRKLAQARKRLPAELQPIMAGWLHRTEGAILEATGQDEEAERQYLKAIEAFERCQDWVGLAQVHLVLGNLGADFDPSAASDHYEQALRFAKKTDDPELLGQVYMAVATQALENQAPTETVIKHLMSALDCMEQVGSFEGQGLVHLQLGVVAQLEEDLPLAKEHLSKALDCLGQAGDPLSLGQASLQMADLLEQEGEAARASQLREEGLEIIRQSGDRLIMCEAWLIEAHRALEREQFDQAKEFFSKSMQLAEELRKASEQEVVPLIDALLGLGSVALVQDNLDQAEQYFQQAKAVAEQADNQPELGRVCFALSELAALRGDQELADALEDRAYQLFGLGFEVEDLDFDDDDEFDLFEDDDDDINLEQTMEQVLAALDVPPDKLSMADAIEWLAQHGMQIPGGDLDDQE